jgi:uncharacterized protein YegJ (DUF2314 family)
MAHALDILDGIEEPSPWRFTPPDPTVLLVPCSGNEHPTLEGVLQSIADFTGQDLGVQSAEPPEEDMLWFAGCTIDGLTEPITVWCQPAGDLEEHAHAVIGTGHEWFVAIQTVLSTDDPMTSYINLVRLITASIPDAPAILDPGSGHWLERDWIEAEFFHDTLEPPEDVLWRLEVIEDECAADAGRWIRTVGLSRCGRAELECTNVPENRTEQALDLLAGLAALSLELNLPGGEIPVEIGPNLRIRLEHSKTTPRDAEHDHPAPITAVLVETADVLNALATDDVAIFLSERRTQQHTLKAQATWTSLLSVCRRLESEHIEHECLLQVPFEQVEGDDSIREHLWLRMIEAGENTADAELVHEPHLVQGVEPGWRTTISIDELSGWLLQGPHPAASSTHPTSLQPYLDEMTTP